ncbi:spermidine/putrescine ABC transporter substrate-binding protein [Hahella sp. CCB-MM4]|uniref:polyamine ABC transporter substrate-binding protein n=1 Tax=Hahella sp. (strain CCB-MM4) TaxID=1926491 RepID=UPI000BDABF74|nr:spermidine/putrescine ABC transporter substrate-binding protein [Hahella sp. CCB-MM4]OZG73808.1 spermidine/putrescine ABC transporter substrate-binding protein [Hahella sp. CCB-MM4]
MWRTKHSGFTIRFCLLIMLAGLLPPLITEARSEQGSPNSESSNTLMLYNWPDYMPVELTYKFHEQTGIRIDFHYFTSDEGKQALLAQTGGKGLDLIIGSGASMRDYIAPQWIAHLKETDLPNHSRISPRWLKFVPELEDYAVPLLWGTIGIAYRPDLLDKEPRSWNDFFHPNPDLWQHIMMINDSVDVFGMAQKSLGLSLNPTSLQDLDAAYRVLIGQKSFVLSYAYPRLDESSELLHGRIAMAMVYSGDALTLQNIDKRIKYVHPEEGTNLWVDYIAVAKASRQPDKALQFINFLLEPENAALMAESLNYASTVRGVEQYQSREHRENQIIYPPADVMEKAESYIPVSPDLVRHRNQLFLELTK